MKILYVGHYSGATGWGQAARDYILAMDLVGIDVVCREIKLNHKTQPLPERIKELEKKSIIGCDVVIQHVLPEHVAYIGGMKNIMLYVDEVLHTKLDSVVSKLGIVDEIWCPNCALADECNYTYLENFLKKSKPVHIVPHAFDTSKLMSSSSGFNFDKQGNFCFYTIADAHRRKNLPGLVQAFNLAFGPEMPVSLVIKSGSNTVDAVSLKKHIENVAEKSARALAIRKEYKMPVVITDRLSDEAITDMHKQLDCFVLPSFGEAWCIPGFEAMAHGKFPILTNSDGPADYIQNNSGLLIPSEYEVVIGVDDGVDYIYNANNIWSVVTVKDTAECMRVAYDKLSHESRTDTVNRKSRMLDYVANEYSYQAIGEKIKGIL